MFPDWSQLIDGELDERNFDHIPSIHKPKVKESGGDPGIAEADQQNRQLLVRLMLEYNITIPAKQFDKWRPTERKTGRIPGVSEGLTCIMTDGLLGFFIREGKQPLYGHVGWFRWDEPDVSYVKYIDEHGEEKFFKQVKQEGAPSAYFKRPSRPREAREKKQKIKKPRVKMTSAGALDLIARMTTGA
jgi:hypothetical protein